MAGLRREGAACGMMYKLCVRVETEYSKNPGMYDKFGSNLSYITLVFLGMSHSDEWCPSECHFWSTPCTSSVSFPCWLFGELLLESAALVQYVLGPHFQMC
ncbi:hypothetical protein GDO81_026100 [Engystomops pustulosus]|uniref:Uncharacterized protein n=1 Tax=Engystomops pustulosus TaxID=76066 RepID=A0AAV6YLN0_ENGPU|nr:hypothetical protein GDO81_026100 [Engystomops pustulosus]